MKPGSHHNGFAVTHALGHMMYFCEIWALSVSWITYIHLYTYIYIYIYIIYIYIYIYIYI